MAVAIPFISDGVLLGQFQDQIIGDLKEKGVDTSACEGSVPQYGIGTRKCLGSSLLNYEKNMRQAYEKEIENYESEHGPLQPGMPADEFFVPAE